MKKISAFTLIELLVVIVIIGILATITTATFNGSIEKSKQAKLLVAWVNDQKQQEADCVAGQDREECGREITTGGMTWSGYDVSIGERVVGTSSVLAGYGEEKVCVDDDESNCDLHGSLYSYDAAQTLCPDGWRLPLAEDFQLLVDNGDPLLLDFSEGGQGSCYLSSGCFLFGYNSESLYLIADLPGPGPGPGPYLRAIRGWAINGGSNASLTVDMDIRALVRCIKE